MKNLEAYLAMKEKKLNTKAGAPIYNVYRPGTEATNELQSFDADYYQQLIGILQCMVELGRFHICAEVSMLSSCLAMPREGRLKSLINLKYKFIHKGGLHL